MSSTLVYRIDVHARLLILRKKFPLYGLILVCTFIDFEEKFPPARLFHPARLLILVCSKFHSTHDPEQSIPKHCQSIPKAIPKYSKVFQSIPKHPKVSQSSNGKKLPPQNSPLHGLILVCTFIDFEKKFFPARLFHPARLLLLACGYFGTL